MVSTDKHFLFIHIPKTGGNAIRLALKDHAIDKIVFNEKQRAYNEENQEVHRFGIQNPYINLTKHSAISDVHAQWNEQDLGAWDSYFKFSVVRNPWDRLVSLYFSPHMGNAEFDREKFQDVLTKTKNGMQSTFVVENAKLAVDYLIRFENLAEDFSHVCEKLGIDAELPHVNQSKRGHYREYYDEKLMNLVARLYKDDIDLFGYEY